MPNSGYQRSIAADGVGLIVLSCIIQGICDAKSHLLDRKHQGISDHGCGSRCGFGISVEGCVGPRDGIDELLPMDEPHKVSHRVPRPYVPVLNDNGEGGGNCAERLQGPPKPDALAICIKRLGRPAWQIQTVSAILGPPL
jgi:hypothetical protein